MSDVNFTCEACGAKDVVSNPEHMARYNCECGAGYFYWPTGKQYGQRSVWKCVVKPIFKTETTKLKKQ